MAQQRSAACVLGSTSAAQTIGVPAEAGVECTDVDGDEPGERAGLRKIDLDRDAPVGGHFFETIWGLPRSVVGLITHTERQEDLFENPKGNIIDVRALRCGAETVAGLCTNMGAWFCIAYFTAAELSTLAATGESFFGTLTGGVVESVRESQGVPMRWHMVSGALMWGLAFVQLCCARLRKGELAWVHRISGRLLLLLWYAVCGPTAAYLSLYCSPGPNRANFAMTMFSVVSLDTTLFASYYFWRGWLVARRRLRGPDSLVLHGKAMRIGFLFTCTIIYQRHVQFFVIAARKLFTTGMEYVPTSWQLTHWFSEWLLTHILDHHTILSLTTVIPFGLIFVLLADGPRSLAACRFLGLGAGDEEELFGSQRPGALECLLWRGRLPLYLALRYWVTAGWTVDPLPQA